MDLSASNLILSAHEITADSVVTMIYLGPRGCRVTLYARPAGLPIPVVPGGEAANWSDNCIDYTLVADGMDFQHFVAVAAYATA
ncbi:MAG: hypothetical protein GDA41_07665 [Rhodospirillales bacterium]|nr:hypothetical protein [Rhodospirillales bacterium]